jgi:hypothetical protein
MKATFPVTSYSTGSMTHSPVRWLCDLAPVPLIRPAGHLASRKAVAGRS